MGENLKIGYQGLEGSNAEEAAHRLAKKLDDENIEFIPLVDSKTVVGELKRKNIDYGVVAVRNSLAGTVVETFEAIKNEYLELVGTEILKIHHCLFKSTKIELSEIDTIASHIQALKQTANNRKNFFPNCTEYEVEDTAIAAKYLSEGKLKETVAVLCRKNAGEMYGLDLVYENLEDDADNATEFRLFKML